jgi:hypothetical protein
VNEVIRSVNFVTSGPTIKLQATIGHVLHRGEHKLFTVVSLNDLLGLHIQIDTIIIIHDP